ncbi:MAG: arylamine N-acetyltransferase [Eubacteriales bacterium]
MYQKEQLIRIFERIGLTYADGIPNNFETLAAVQYGFQKNIPYENLDILKKVPLSLDYDRLYDKIVLHHRGGYCFELNGFLGEVYRSLGFDVTEYMARYLRGETEIPMRRHRVLGVRTADGKTYICDAGIGQSAFRIPLLLEENSHSVQYGEEYRVTREPFFGWMIADLHHGAWRRFYSFIEEEQLNIDYIMPSFWCENAKESPFTSAEIFSIKTDDGRITLDANVLHLFSGDTVTEKFLNEDEVREAYSKYFGLPYDAATAAGLRRYREGERA